MKQIADVNNRPAQLFGKNCHLDLNQPQIMGILNITPDSFSDGGLFLKPEAALSQARKMIDAGANILDIGGESTRPGAPVISSAEELDRILPVIEHLRTETNIPLSVDTTKAAVAAAAIEAGANFINDVSALTFDAQMARTAADTGAGLFLMHTRGRPEVMQRNTRYDNLLEEVLDTLMQAVERAAAVGVERRAIAIDPGIGFGKNVRGNLQLLQHLDQLVASGYPVLLGTSRKSFLGQILHISDPVDRLSGTLATIAMGVARGAQIFRVHDVRPAREAALIAWAVREGELPIT